MCVCVCKAQMVLVDWKENRLFNTLIMQNLYIVNIEKRERERGNERDREKECVCVCVRPKWF